MAWRDWIEIWQGGSSSQDVPISPWHFSALDLRLLRVAIEVLPVITRTPALTAECLQ